MWDFLCILSYCGGFSANIRGQFLRIWLCVVERWKDALPLVRGALCANAGAGAVARVEWGLRAPSRAPGLLAAGAGVARRGTRGRVCVEIGLPAEWAVTASRCARCAAAPAPCYTTPSRRHTLGLKTFVKNNIFMYLNFYYLTWQTRFCYSRVWKIAILRPIECTQKTKVRHNNRSSSFGGVW